MAVLAPPIHIKGNSGPGSCIRYIQDPEKIVADSQTANVMHYMQSHCIEEIASVGYNGCSGVCELAVEQFRLAEANYKASHAERQYQQQEISVLQYLEKNHKGQLPKKLKPIPPADRELEMTLDDALKTWRDTNRTEEERAAAREVLEAYTIKPKIKTPTLAEHLVISAHRTDNPSPAQLQAVVDKFMEHPYLKDFPALSNIHWNTDEKHAHVLISNYAANGSRTLSLSGKKLTELRRYLDKICYEHGLSIIDTAEVRRDPEHAKWIDAVKAEGKINVWPEKEAKASRNWMADHNKKAAKKEARIDGNPKLHPIVKEELKDIARNDLFAGDGKIIPYTIRSLTAEEVAALAAEERRRRAKNNEDEARRRRRDEEQWRRTYVVRIYVYDPYRHRYRQRSTLELLFILARIIITGETDFLEDNYPKKYEKFEATLNAPTNWKIQNMYDSINICQDLNARTPEELGRRAQEIGVLIGDKRRAISADERTVEQGRVLYDAIQKWWNTSLSEEERKEAYHTLASYKCTDPIEMENLVARYHKAQERLPKNKQQLEDLNKRYRDAKRAQNSLNTLSYECQTYTAAAREAAKDKPELGAKVRKAQRKAEEAAARKRAREQGKTEFKH